MAWEPLEWADNDPARGLSAPRMSHLQDGIVEGIAKAEAANVAVDLLGSPVVAPTAGTVPQRTAAGTVKTAAPVDDDDAVSLGRIRSDVVPVIAPRSPDVQGAPLFARHDAPLITHAATGFPTIYWPFVVDVGHVPGALGRWYLYYSTDHDAPGTGTGFNGLGGLGMAYADDILGPYTVHTSGGLPVVYQDTTAGDQTETPTVIWNDATGLFHIYYQQQGVGVNQATCLVTSPSGLLNDPGNVRVGVVIKGDATRAGDGQSSYAKVWRSGASWVAYHLFGGGPYGAGGISRSHDGITWVTDPRRIYAKDWSGDPGVRIASRRQPFFWRGEWWAIGGWSAYQSGFWTGDVPWYVGRLTEDFRHLKGGPLPVALDPAAGEADSTAPTSVVAHEGHLYAFYRSNGQYGAIRAAIAEA